MDKKKVTLMELGDLGGHFFIKVFGLGPLRKRVEKLQKGKNGH